MRKTVFVLALPVLLEQFLSFCVGFYDTLLSGHLGEEIGADATSAVGLAAYVGWLGSMLFALVATGTTALVARHWGAGEFEQANRITNRSMALAAVLGVFAFGLLFVSAPLFPRLLNMSDRAAGITIRYLRFDAIGLMFTAFSLVGAAALRGTGNMRTPMLILGWVSVLNVIASTALVYGIGPLPVIGIEQSLLQPMGIDGIVTGTIIARTSGGIWMIAVMMHGTGGLKLRRSELKIRGESARRILRIGGPAALDGIVMWIGHFLFLMIIAALGNGGMDSAVFASHIVGIRVEAITYLPAVAWGMAAATLIGQSLGAGDRQRAMKAGHEAALQCSLMAVVIMVVFFVAAGPIYRTMHIDPAVQAVGIPAFRMLAFFQVPLVVSIVYVAALRGAGDTRFPLFITAISMVAVRLPLAYLCGITLGGGLYGAWIGMCADMTARALFAGIRYTRGQWQETKV